MKKDDFGSKMSGDELAVDLPWPGDWDRWGGGTSPPPQDVVRATDCKARWRGRPVREALASLGLEGPYATAAIGAGRVRVNAKEANGLIHFENESFLQISELSGKGAQDLANFLQIIIASISGLFP